MCRALPGNNGLFEFLSRTNPVRVEWASKVTKFVYEWAFRLWSGPRCSDWASSEQKKFGSSDIKKLISVYFEMNITASSTI